MRIKAAALAALLFFTASATSCSSGSKTSSEASSEITIVDYPDAEETIKNKYANVEGKSDGPVLKVSDVTAAAGETAAVTLSVSGSDGWCMCGIHLTYPKELECVMRHPETREAEFMLGDASQAAQASLAKTWLDNFPRELEENGLASVFFTEIFNGDDGENGDIVTFKFKIPADAKSGTVYPVGMYFLDTDMFQNSSKDVSMEKYAFEHFQSGSITVK